MSHWYDRRARATPNPERAERLGTLVASGLIVGESIWGVINAGLIVAFSKDAPIALVPEEFAPAPWLGLLGFVGVIVWLYGWMLRRARAARPRSGPPAGTFPSSFAHRPSSVAPARHR